MAFSGMKTMGPDCCCGCMDFYLAQTPNYYHGHGDLAHVSFYAGGINTQNRFYFDYANKHLYTQNHGNPGGGTPSRILRMPQDVSSTTTVLSVDPTYTIGETIGVNHQAEYIYYGTRQTASPTDTGAIRRCNYDGTGDTLLLAHTFGAIGIVSYRSFRISLEEEYVFYTVGYSDGSSRSRLRRCNKDGTGDIEIYNGDAVGLVLYQTVDNVNKRIFWSAANRFIYRSDFDGVGATQIFDGNDASHKPPFPATGTYTTLLGTWSHRHERLYFFIGSGVARNGLGMYSIQYDGSDLREEMTYENMRNSTGGLPVSDTAVSSGSQMAISCGYETTGSGTMAS